MILSDRLGYIAFTLAQRGIQPTLMRYRQETVPVQVDRIEIAAYNAILFLLNASVLPIGTRFLSDTNVFDIVQAQSLEGLEEFSGLLTVTFPAVLERPLGLEFVQILR